jgi:hypothetical protein
MLAINWKIKFEIGLLWKQKTKKGKKQNDENNQGLFLAHLNA